MTDGWSEGWPKKATVCKKCGGYTHHHCSCSFDDWTQAGTVKTLVVPLSESVPRSELEPILDGLVKVEAGTHPQMEQGIWEALDAVTALLSTDSEEG